jgi:hypothetical protein
VTTFVKMRDRGFEMKRWVAVLIVVAACGNITRKQDDAGVKDDGKVIDAAIDSNNIIPADASPDAPPPSESREVVNGAGSLQGTTYTMDVQVGHPIQQETASGTTYTMESNAAVKP